MIIFFINYYKFKIYNEYFEFCYYYKKILLLKVIYFNYFAYN